MCSTLGNWRVNSLPSRAKSDRESRATAFDSRSDFALERREFTSVISVKKSLALKRARLFT